MDNLRKSFKSVKWYEWIMIVIMIAIAGWSMIKAFINPTESSLPVWLTVVNFISAICGIICVFFCAKASISNFAFGLVNTIVYAIYLLYSKIYGTFCLEVLFYLPTGIISWILWCRHRDQIDTEKTKSKKLDLKQNIISVIVVALTTVVTYLVLSQTSDDVALLDALTVAIGIVATVLEMKRYREQYVWWLVTDVVAVTMYIVHFDPVYLTKKIIYLIMAFIGLYNWAKLNKTRNKENE